MNCMSSGCNMHSMRVGFTSLSCNLLSMQHTNSVPAFHLFLFSNSFALGLHLFLPLIKVYFSCDSLLNPSWSAGLYANTFLIDFSIYFPIFTRFIGHVRSFQIALHPELHSKLLGHGEGMSLFIFFIFRYIARLLSEILKINVMYTKLQSTSYIH
jgi:hypothetical protein